MLKAENLGCTIGGRQVLDNISLNIEKGSFTALIGSNGSGKSTLAKCLCALIQPDTGTVSADSAGGDIYALREAVGMVFQDPESQSAAPIVGDDVAFGPENLGLGAEEAERRVLYALDAVGITELETRNISTLSGGQKQLAAIASVLAMQPRYIIFDESTSMLDPKTGESILRLAHRLCDDLGTAVIWITHEMTDTVNADRVTVLDSGSIAADGTPDEIFSDLELTARTSLDLPPCAKLLMMLREAGYNIPRISADPAQAADILCELIDTKGGKQC